MSRFHCPACGTSHYDGSGCPATDTTVNQYDGYCTRGNYRTHCFCSPDVCHDVQIRRYGDAYNADDCGPHCLTSSGYGANSVYWRDGGEWPIGTGSSKPVAAIPEKDAGGYCIVCGSRHSASAHGDLWWIDAPQSRGTQSGTVSDVDKALAALRAKLTGDETPA